MTTNNKKGQYKLHNMDAVKNKRIKNYINIQISLFYCYHTQIRIRTYLDMSEVEHVV